MIAVFSEDNRVLLILVSRRYGPQRDQTTSLSEEKNVSGLKTHKKQDKTPLCFLAFSANGFKAMRQAEDKRLKKRGFWVTVFWLYSPAGFELDAQEASDSRAFLAHVSVRAYDSMTAILTLQKDRQREKRNMFTIHCVSNESYEKGTDAHTGISVRKKKGGPTSPRAKSNKPSFS